MSLLDHLWDDTVAGPTPESGLGKLRKHSTFSSRSNSGKELEAASARSYGGGDAPSEATRKVTRSITIVRPPGYQSGSPPASPAGSATPGSPFSERVCIAMSNMSLDDEIGFGDSDRYSSNFKLRISESSSRGSCSDGTFRRTESPFGSGEDLRRTRMRRQAKLDQKAPLLFKSSDI